MKFSWKISLCICLSLAAAWGGRHLALRERWDGDVRSEPAAGTACMVAAGPVAGSGDEMENRRAAASCTTAALWELLKRNDDDDNEDDFDLRQAVRQELLDREGPAAVLQAEEMADAADCPRLTHGLLWALARKNPGKALELYLTLPPDCGDDLYGWETCDQIQAGAAGESAESLIAVLDGLKGKLDGLPPYYAEDFDFRKLAEHALDSETRVPDGMMAEWAGRSPLAALDWLAAHPGPGGQANAPAGGIAAALKSIASSPGPEREEALLRIAQYYPDSGKRSEVWAQLAGQPGKVDPDLARIAAGMGSQEAYLVTCLEWSRSTEEQDPSWARIPADQREAALTETLAKWRREDPSARGDKARASWQARMEKACGK